MKKLGRTRSMRQALIKSLAAAFVANRRIETTHAKAKMVQPIIEKLTRLAKNHGRSQFHKQLLAFFQDKTIVGKLFDHVSGLSRSSGFTRLIHTGIRHGDRARLSRLEWTDPAPTVPSSPSNPPLPSPHKTPQSPLKSSKISADKTHSGHKTHKTHKTHSKS